MGHASPEAALRFQHAARDRNAAIATLLGDLIAPQPAPVVELRPETERAGDGPGDR